MPKVMSKNFITDNLLGRPIVGYTRDEAREVCVKLGGHLATDAEFDAFGEERLPCDSEHKMLWAWCDTLDDTPSGEPPRNLRGGPTRKPDPKSCTAAASQGQAPTMRALDVGFRCVWDSPDKVPPGIETIEVPEKLVTLGHITLEPLRLRASSGAGAVICYLRALTFAEADMLAASAGGQIPSKEVYDALGDATLPSGLWSWSTEVTSTGLRVVRAGAVSGGLFGRAAMKASTTEGHRCEDTGVRVFWPVGEEPYDRLPMFDVGGLGRAGLLEVKGKVST